MAAELFISYARKDSERVLPWVQQLQAAELSTWMDVSGIDGALLWGQEIVAAIENCRVLLLMVSAHSVASEQVVREVSLAVDTKKPIFPLLLEPVTIPPALRYPLAGIQHLELFGGDPEGKLQAILRSLSRLGISAAEAALGGGQPAPISAPGQDRHLSPTVAGLRHNLPLQLTSFVGREVELAAVREQLGSARLLTLTGVGGCGKTRLALQAAAELVEQFPDGVWLVELAALADPGLVPQAVAKALRLREQPGSTLTETLVEHLRSRDLLLVLDNCEHLVAGCATLAHELLRYCPHLRVLATSREPLAVPGEVV